MSAKLILDANDMHESFFRDTVLIGIVCAYPSYRFCALMNSCLDLRLARDGESDICVKNSQNTSSYFAFYRYQEPMASNEFSLYELKREKQFLLPELKQLDYLFMMKGPEAEEDADKYTEALRTIPDIQLAQLIDMDKLKNVDYLMI